MSLFLGRQVVWGTRSPPTIFLARGFQHGESCSGAKRLPEHGLCRKNTTEGSLEEDRKLNAERDAFGIPQTKHHRDIIDTRRSAPGKRIQKWGSQPTHLGNGRQVEQGCTVRMEHLASSPALPQSAPLSQLFNREFRVHPWLQIYTFNSWTL